MTTMLINPEILTNFAQNIISSEPLSKAEIKVTVSDMKGYFRIWFNVSTEPDYAKPLKETLVYCDMFPEQSEEHYKIKVYDSIEEIQLFIWRAWR